MQVTVVQEGVIWKWQIRCIRKETTFVNRHVRFLLHTFCLYISETLYVARYKVLPIMLEKHHVSFMRVQGGINYLKIAVLLSRYSWWCGATISFYKNSKGSLYGTEISFK
jgi:hypothetical protein